MRAIIYCRVSSDPHARGKSVTEQESDCRATAKAHGWDVGEVLVDNDRGASRYSRKDRPAYRRLAETLTPGDVLVTWEASRAQRDLSAYLQLRDLCSERGVLWSYSGRTYDLARGDDRFTTGLDALLSEKEVEVTRERVLRSMRANAAAGRPHGKLAYGFMIVRDPHTGQSLDRVPNPETAPTFKEAADRVLDGESLYAVCNDFNARGIPAPRPRRDGTPAKWIPVTLRKILESPTYAGLRQSHGEVTGPATWEPLISMEQHERLKALFADPNRLTQRGSEPRWLLAGIARCGVCGATVKRIKSRGIQTYMCRDKFCAARMVATVDDYVVEAVMRRLEGQDLVGQIDSDNAEYGAAIENVRALQQRLDSFTDAAAEGEVTPAALARIEAKLLPQIERAEGRVRALAHSPAVARIAGAGARERWELLAVRDRRDIVRALVDVQIHRIGKGRRNVPIGEGIELSWL
ncbi:serine integrase [Gordonia phage Wocket]|nr:serine integrase [Gordonia phage Wocket]